MSLLTQYHHLIIQQRLQTDTRQLQVVRLLDDFAAKLEASAISRRWWTGKKQPPSSIYLFGDVGRGKTMLMDLLYTHVQVAKQRIHFGAFMLKLHQDLRSVQGKKNPLDLLAAATAKKIDLLCFDEFQVHDIADAMLLGRFFDKLLDTGVVICATSNTHPDDLYAEGLQRERFMPVIQRINQHFVLVPMFQGGDYRRCAVPESSRWISPADNAARNTILVHLCQLQDAPHVEHSVLMVNGRPLPSVATLHHARAAVFTFDALCDSPRSSSDYMQIASNWTIVAILGIPQFDDTVRDKIKRFILLTDQLYEHDCACLFSAATTIEQLYTGSQMTDQFARCASRLYSLQQRPLPDKPFASTHVSIQQS